MFRSAETPPHVQISISSDKVPGFPRGYLNGSFTITTNGPTPISALQVSKIQANGLPVPSGVALNELPGPIHSQLRDGRGRALQCQHCGDPRRRGHSALVIPSTIEGCRSRLDNFAHEDIQLTIGLAAHLSDLVRPRIVAAHSGTGIRKRRAGRIIDDDAQIARKSAGLTARGAKNSAICIRKVHHELPFQIDALATSTVVCHLLEPCCIKHPASRRRTGCEGFPSGACGGGERDRRRRRCHRQRAHDPGRGRRRDRGEGRCLVRQAVGAGHRLGPECLERRGSSMRYRNPIA